MPTSTSGTHDVSAHVHLSCIYTLQTLSILASCAAVSAHTRRWFMVGSVQLLAFSLMLHLGCLTLSLSVFAYDLQMRVGHRMRKGRLTGFHLQQPPIRYTRSTLPHLSLSVREGQRPLQLGTCARLSPGEGEFDDTNTRIIPHVRTETFVS